MNGDASTRKVTQTAPKPKIDWRLCIPKSITIRAEAREEAAALVAVEAM
ncbi:MAG TPA: hypothetical protein VHC73_01890 [Vitreimonas sp.]|nr:hypothetical protein [Vitreimonas sp.]